MKKNKSERIMEAVDRSRNTDDEELLGFVISESIDNYTETGQDVLRLFETYPEQAERFDNMLVAVCGWGIESLLDRMEEQRDYFESL